MSMLTKTLERNLVKGICQPSITAAKMRTFLPHLFQIIKRSLPNHNHCFTFFLTPDSECSSHLIVTWIVKQQLLHIVTTRIQSQWYIYGCCLQISTFFPELDTLIQPKLFVGLMNCVRFFPNLVAFPCHCWCLHNVLHLILKCLMWRLTHNLIRTCCKFRICRRQGFHLSIHFKIHYHFWNLRLKHPENFICKWFCIVRHFHTSLFKVTLVFLFEHEHLAIKHSSNSYSNLHTSWISTRESKWNNLVTSLIVNSLSLLHLMWSLIKNKSSCAK